MADRQHGAPPSGCRLRVRSAERAVAWLGRCDSRVTLRRTLGPRPDQGAAYTQRDSALSLHGLTSDRLLWFVREAWPSPATGTSLVAGELTVGRLRLTVELERLAAFGDGMEDALSLV